MHSFWMDLRYGVRMLMKRPGFTLVAVATLALGIGANTAIFSLVNATLLRRLPVFEPDRLVYAYSGRSNNPYGVASYLDYVDLRDRNQVFSGLAAWGAITVSLNNDGQADAVNGGIVSGDYFEVLGVGAKLGRPISSEDDRTVGAHPVTVISHGLWQRRFGGDPGIIGRQINLNGQSFAIIGVLPEDFVSPFLPGVDDLYVPMMMQASMRPPRTRYSGEMNPDLLQRRGNRWLSLIGRLKSGVTREQAQASLVAITRRQEELYPNTNRNRIVTLTPASEGDPTQRGSLISTAGLLVSVVAIVLLIACANVASLLLARASGRRREIAVRLALGANRRHLIRQLLIESTLLSLIGGAAGWLLAVWVTDLMKAASPPPGVLPITFDFNPDLRVLGFTLGLSLLTGVIFGLAPALQASRPELVSALRDESVTFDRLHWRFDLRKALVVAQVTLSLMLLIGAGLFLRSLWRVQAIEPGFDDERLLTLPLNINLLRYTRAQSRGFYREAIERIEAIPGVESASLTRILPLNGISRVHGLLIEGQDGPDRDMTSEGTGFDGSVPDTISVSVIGLKYFQTMGIGLVKGRDFDGLGVEGRPDVVVVNETFAQHYLAGQEVLGKRLSFDGSRGPWREIVGVVRDSKYLTLGEAPRPFAYLPLGQNHETGMVLIARAGHDPIGLTAAVRQAIQSLEPNLPVTDVRPITQLIGNSLYAARMGAILIGGFGLSALMLSAVGLYGLMAYVVAQRTREIGIRMALGAQKRDVLQLVLKEAMLLVGIGVTLGLAASVGLSHLLAGFLYGISSIDAVTFVVIPAILASVGLIAAVVPARRAMKVDPMIALRYQ